MWTALMRAQKTIPSSCRAGWSGIGVQGPVSPVRENRGADRYPRRLPIPQRGSFVWERGCCRPLVSEALVLRDHREAAVRGTPRPQRMHRGMDGQGSGHRVRRVTGHTSPKGKVAEALGAPVWTGASSSPTAEGAGLCQSRPRAREPRDYTVPARPGCPHTLTAILPPYLPPTPPTSGLSSSQEPQRKPASPCKAPPL